jgi:nitrogen fixation NifU-like protein
MSDALYHDAILARAKAGRVDSRLDPHDGRATADNPLCGDRVTFDLRLDGARVREAGHRTRGCALCEASAETLRIAAPGRDESELKDGREAVAAFIGSRAPLPSAWEAFAIFAPLHDFPSRHGCVLLAFDAIEGAVSKAAAKA